MLVPRVRSVYWKKWTAKYEYEELKEGAWLERGLTPKRKKERENWTEKHRIVARKIFLEGGWTQKEAYSILAGRISVSDKSSRWRKAQKDTDSTTVTEWHAVRRGIQEIFSKWEQKEWRWQRGVVALLSVKASGTEDISQWKCWSLRSTKAGVCKSKVSGTSMEAEYVSNAPSRRRSWQSLYAFSRTCDP